MHLFQSSPSRPPRNPARIRPSTSGVDSSWSVPLSDGSSSLPVTLSDIVLLRRHKSTGTKIRQPPSKAARPRANSAAAALLPLTSARPNAGPSPLHSRPATPSRSGTTPKYPNSRPATAPKPTSHPRPRPATAPYPPRSRPSTASNPPSSLRPQNPALALLLATKPPPPPPPHQRATSLHAQSPPPLRLRTSFSSSHPFPDTISNANPQSNVLRERPTSAYVPVTTSKPNHATTKPQLPAGTKPFPSPAPLPTPRPKSQPPQFSTADRTILEELKRSISAKAAQFVVKGDTHGGVIGEMGMGNRGGSRHHPFRKEEVPYPRCYERGTVDLDVWETAFCEQISDSLTWHVFEEPPTKVLDIGSGTGTWILNCARLWKRCHFVGLDIVPLHPDLQRVGSSDLASRITWVQENFLNGLPFPNGEFDFVHIKRIARGVPEDKWDSLFEEITRVMKPGGAFEMIEEDLFFPGKDPDSDDGDWTSFDLHSCFDSNHEDVDNMLTSSSAPQSSAMPTENLVAPATRVTLPPTPPPSSYPSPLHSTQAVLSVDLTLPAREKTGIPESSSRSQPESGLPHAPLPRNPQAYSKLKNPTQGHFHLHLPSRPLSQSKFASSTASLISAFAPGYDSIYTKARPSTAGSLTMVSSPMATTVYGSTNALHSPKTLVGKSPQGSPFLLKTLPRPPANPRDHRLLETIYTEMHAARFINLSPLSLLANTLGLHFKDVRTHPPLQFTFPPRPKPRGDSFTPRDSGVDSDRSSDSDEARNALHDPETMKPSKAHQNDYGWVSLQNLLDRSSPYVQLDDTRTSAFSPSSKAYFPARSPGLTSKSPLSSPLTAELSLSGTVSGSSNAKPLNAVKRWATASRLPNTTLHVDLRTLNLHLALRTADTLACAEAMWEWVVDFQAAQARKRAQEARVRSGSVDSPGQTATVAGAADMIRNAINTLTRADFDALLTKFDLDMRDHVGLESAMKERFAWSVFPTSPPSERRMFDSACRKWEQWELEQQAQQRSRPSKRHTADGFGLDHGANRAFHVPIGEAGTLKRRSSASAIRASYSPSTRRLSRTMRVFVAWKA